MGGAGRQGKEWDRMISNVEYEHLTPVAQMRGEDDEETCQLRACLEDAKNYLKSHVWCRGILREFFGLGIGGVVSVFLFEIAPAAGVDDCLWVVCGDLPSAYLVTDAASTPVGALRIYCDMMEAWISAVRRGGRLDDVFPVTAEPSEETAKQLEKRVSLLRTEIIPAFS